MVWLEVEGKNLEERETKVDYVAERMDNSRGGGNQESESDGIKGTYGGIKLG